MAKSSSIIFKDCVVDRNNPYYRKAMQRESLFWKRAFELEHKVNKHISPSSSGEHYEQLKKQYDNIRLTGNLKRGTKELLKSAGPFKRALSLGAGRATFEFGLVSKNIVDRVDVIDFSKASIEQIKQRAQKEKLSSRITASYYDLNFIELEENKYDLIICRNILHHIVNLEHVLYQANKALTKNGILFIEDYIGENKFQWTKKRSAFIRRISRSLPVKINKKRAVTTKKALLNYLSPFESIRSEDIPSVIDRYFGKTKKKEVKYGEVFHLWEVIVNPHQQISNLDRGYKILFELDSRYAKNKTLKPVRIIGLYSKNKRLKQENIRNWSKKDVKYNFGFSFLDVSVLKEIIKR